MICSAYRFCKTPICYHKQKHKYHKMGCNMIFCARMNTKVKCIDINLIVEKKG